MSVGKANSRRNSESCSFSPREAESHLSRFKKSGNYRRSAKNRARHFPALNHRVSQ